MGSGPSSKQCSADNQNPKLSWTNHIRPKRKASSKSQNESKMASAVHRKPGRSFLTDANIRRLASETHFSEKEVQGWYSDFLRDCADGQLTKAQFAEVYRQMCGSGDAKDNRSSYIFAAFDIDRNGKIDFEEFLKAISVTTRGTYSEKLEMVFRMYDVNNDGTLERKELRMILNTLFNASISNEQLNHLFNTLDVNKDNRVSKSEFMKICSKSDEIRNILDDSYTEADF